MSISAARAYILTKVQLVDPFLSEQDDAFGDRDISTTQTEKFYKLVFGSADQTNTDGNAYGLFIPLTFTNESRFVKKRLSFTTMDAMASLEMDKIDLSFQSVTLFSKFDLKFLTVV